MKSAHIHIICRVTGFIAILALAFTLLLSTPLSVYSEQVETPASFMARKKSSYKAALEELKKEYRKWCVVAGKPIIPAGIEQGQPPWDLGQPPGDLPGEMQLVRTPGLDGEFSYEIEQVINTWYSGSTGTNPFSWVDINGIFTTTGSRSGSGDQCSGKSMVFDTTAPGGPYAGIVLNETTRSCSLVNFSSSSSSSVYFNSLITNNYQYGPGAGWSGGPVVSTGVYGTTYVKTYSKGSNTVGISFKVTNNTPANPNNAVLNVNSVNW